MSTGRRFPHRLALTALVAVAAVLLIVRLTTGDAGTPDAGVPTSTPSPGTASTAAEPIIAPHPRAATPVSARALGGIHFDDVTDAVGLRGPASDAGSALAGVGPQMNSGAAVTTIHGSTYLLLTYPSAPVELYLVGAHFTDVTAAAGLAHITHVTTATFADIDGDGTTDLLLARPGKSGMLVLLGDGHGHFHRDGSSGIAPPRGHWAYGASPRGLALADVNGDGHLDLVVADWNPTMALDVPQYPSLDPGVAACKAANRMRALPANAGVSQARLYLGDGAGHFTDATRAWGLNFTPVFGFTPQFVDINADGRPDLLLTGDVCSGRIYENTGHGFTDITRRTTAPMAANGMGATITDLDGDGRPDWLVTGISYPTATGKCPKIDVISGCSGNRAYVNNGDGTFRDETDRYGVRESGWGWGVAAADFGNDGRQEIAVTNGFLSGANAAGSQRDVYYTYFATDPMSFFVPTGGDDVHADAAAQVGLSDTGVGHALLSFDFNHDGRLDLLVNDSDSGPHLFENVTPAGGRHWVTVRLDDPTDPGNPAGYGAKIEVISAAGRSTYGWITSNTSYETQALPQFHVGLGTSTGHVTVKVWWPGSVAPTTYRDRPVDRVVTVRR